MQDRILVKNRIFYQLGDVLWRIEEHPTHNETLEALNRSDTSPATMTLDFDKCSLCKQGRIHSEFLHDEMIERHHEVAELREQTGQGIQEIVKRHEFTMNQVMAMAY